MKVLLVDDTPTALRLMRAALEGNNFELVEARDGVQALAVLEREPVDAIISDILMPHMDGYRLCQEVRKSKRWQNLPFIFYTATYTSPSDEKLCYDLGGDNYLKKPAAAKVLLAALSEATNATRGSRPKRGGSSYESSVMKEYSERLVSKLEERNQELARRTEQLEQAREDLQRANRELDTRVQQATAELKVANKELESFSFSVSHDLRAPLRHIGGFIDILFEDCAGQLNETNLKHLQSVKASTQKMGELIDALLELSAVTCAEIHRCPVDLTALAAEVFAELQQNNSSRIVKFGIAPNMIARGDERLLRVVLVNLLGNAWKYTQKRASAQIEFGKSAGNGEAVYFVRDNGAGFDMALADKLFGAFQRLHSNTDFEGIGIGLATVQRIIHRHKGKIWAESIGHQGATFYFTLNDGDPKQVNIAS